MGRTDDRTRWEANYERRFSYIRVQSRNVSSRAVDCFRTFAEHRTGPHRKTQETVRPGRFGGLKMPPQFTKFHGLGNDYLVIEVEQLAGIDDLGDFAKRICNRHYGAGGDGIAVIGPVIDKSANAGADFTCRIFNPDGSEAGLSGNGTRCAVAYLHYRGLWTKEELRLSTRTGLKRYFLRGQPGPGKYLFESELGQPKFDSRSIPMSIDPPLERVINYPFETFQITAMQMGNPNC